MKKKTSSGRCQTGIGQLDELLEGGFPRGRTMLVSGSCGTGKTILATQFLYNGIIKYDESGVLVLLEQNPDEFKEDMLEFDFDLEKLEEEGKLVIIDASLSKISIENVIGNVPVSSKSFSLLPGERDLKKLLDVVMRAAKKIGAKRAVIDSIQALDLMVKDETEARKLIVDMNYKLKSAGLTSIIISESGHNTPTEGVEKYIVDGVISLRYTTTGPDVGRTLVIDKMRRTSHSEEIHTLKFIKGQGITLQDE